MKRIFALILSIVLIFFCSVSVFAADLARSLAAADALHELGLFSGTGTDDAGKPIYALEKPLSRQEAIALLVALLGKSDEARSGEWVTPFTDVADWAKPYVGYAYTNGLTSGISATKFGANDRVSAAQYITFLLGALGYRNGSDFTWNESWKFADTLGITAGEYRKANNESFLRGDVVIVSYNALFAAKKDGGKLVDGLSGNVLKSVKPTVEVNWKKVLNYPDPVPSESNPNGLMAHNIYSDPVLSNQSGRYTGFLIDFKADQAPKGTYWALCNWTMDTSSLAANGTITDGGGAYAGLQQNPSGPQSIMSFWEITYKDSAGTSHKVNAKRVYPATDHTNTFTGEGEGTNYIADYHWEPGKWYRMYLTCYNDAASGHTFVEQWFQDLSDNRWTKACTFDTGLENSCFIGAMSQFMENYDYETANMVRTFEYRNIYVRNAKTGTWESVTKSKLSIDTWWGNKKGTYAFGANSTSLYGITCGYGKDTAALNADISGTYTIQTTADPVVPSAK
ncbi:MAG: DUF3472 domain-containing protein [Firmicutes bacterium]|nr:DUF3472 domain-containing protein [Bacillota bacterium]